MVIIRLSRTGANKRPFYNMVVTDCRKRRDGKPIERIGYFNPIARGQETRLFIQLEKVAYWQSVGAKLSERAKQLTAEFIKTAHTQQAENLAQVTSTAGVTKKERTTTRELIALTGQSNNAHETNQNEMTIGTTSALIAEEVMALPSTSEKKAKKLKSNLGAENKKSEP